MLHMSRSVLWRELVQQKTLVSLLKKLKQQGFWVIGTSLDGDPFDKLTMIILDAEKKDVAVGT